LGPGRRQDRPLAVANRASSESAVRAADQRGWACSHTRRGLAAGLSRAEIEQVALLAITTTGWPSAFAAYSWLGEVFAEQDSGTGK
jgi:alkylhydroperoxidase/carboxymuconolactone decarboxylase family protein YurZ